MTEALSLSPHVVAEWLPFWKAAGFFFATFILEDVAAIGAGLLLASGQMSWPAAFGSCFLGIWLGDAGLYAIARIGGRRWFERSRFKKFAAKVERSEQWFAKRGTSILIFSRLVPGARLPTYLAAGFLRVSLTRFLLVTGVASFVWTFAILRLTQLFGAQLLDWLNAYKHGGLILLGVGLGLVVLLQLARRWLVAVLALQERRPRNSRRNELTSRVSISEALRRGTRRWFSQRENLQPSKAAAVGGPLAKRLQFRWRKLARLRHWEFWPGWMFYPPVAIYCLWLAIKYRGLTLPTAANPGIFSGGIVGESKMVMLEQLSATNFEFTAEAALVQGDSVEDRATVLRRVRERLGLNYPFILKPDVGQRGMGIKLIRTPEQAEDYLRQTEAPLVAQRYAPGPHEVGIFYYRFPSELHGRIFAITEKIFPVITGDGRSTVAELIERDSRAQLIADKYLHRFAARREEILAADEQLKLVESGNHAQGCIFRDGIRFHTPELEARIDEISRQIEGFFIGRYDIRFASEDDLRAGKNFQIIELNGAASEATSIYDARNSLWTAYRTLFEQWELVFAIGAANRKRGVIPTKLFPVWRAWRNCCEQAATYPAAD
jgi:membrane protein DedA with SNARE-associated domain